MSIIRRPDTDDGHPTGRATVPSSGARGRKVSAAPARQARSRPSAFGRVVRSLIFVGSAATILGFFAFVHVVTSDRTLAAPSGRSGIVALTGGDGRIESALDMLDRGQGERLLISGVHRDVRAGDLASRYDSYAEQFRCCVDLDFAALDTRGNAREAVAWARRNGFANLIVVTSDWHMPRALVEIRHEADGERIVGSPVNTPTIRERLWLSNSGTLRRLLEEYAKLVLSLVRTIVPSSPVD